MASPHAEELPAEGTADPDAHIYEEVTLCERMELSQRLAVEELITTEASYVHNLQLCLSDIRAHLQQKQLPGLDLEGLFSNIDDILHLSRRFLRGLEATAAQEHDQLLGISTLFQEFKEEMETVYKTYCASYDNALLLVESYRKDPRLQEEIMDTLNATVPHTSASDLSFFLVMPVQRVTKYPLLLGKILENTPAGTNAHQALAATVSTMAQVNANINEYKRQREVATKYNKAEHLTLRDRLARLNTHSIAKKTTRLSRLLMHEAGFVSKTEDKEYDNLEEKFQSVASSVAALKENVASYMAHLEAFLVPAPHKRELQMEEGPAQQYQRLAEHLHRAVFPEFKQRLDRLVWQPLCSLSEMLVGPQQLVKKRLDKLLDYEEIQERKSELGSVTYDEEAAMNTYLAINALLVAELPRFNQLVVQLLGQVLGSLCVLHQDLAAEVLHEAEKELKQLPHGHMTLPAFWRLVEDTLQQAGAQLCTFTQAFETVTPSPVTQPLTAAEERKVLSLVSKHGPDKLYQVTSNVSGSKDLDLTLQRGQIVALLQRVDTKGNTSRWLVDAGGPRGFVPAGKLQPYSPVQGQQTGMQTPTQESVPDRRRHSYASPEAPRPQVATFTPAFQMVAGFSFAARSPQEVSLQAGQPVVVLEPHDKKGSKEWSLVEVNGQRGYVPSSYLVTVPVQEPMGWSVPV
ncbi:rho guanine nucleotide exchange factor 37 [Anas platyrhynchos]|uniref:Rho guanine nucleotide exchange factor 37 n=4 Tax=Anas TaxID=8835 RepID=U3ISD3_ANAPP|nr:rho guanine nucleotide exchange factor 37 [Anas platyrhynchos]XP_038042474.1 rho guanine nucleotide exchange factor 37 [Anas platyrhynchos]|eukprot:XP_027320931.1 rho guanine nucleotide exchange factor 37 isoform X1 [Anas platyrhynchos]